MFEESKDPTTFKEKYKDILWDIKYFFRKWERFIAYRTFDKYNIIKIRSLPPSYYDTDSRLLHGMFDLLTDFVEVELAGRERDSELYHKAKSITSKVIYRLTPGFVKYKRSKEYGLKAIDFYRNCTAENEDEQFYVDSIKAYGNELYELYTWWVDKRPVRPDSWALSGLDKFHALHKKIHYSVPVTINGQKLYEMKSLLSEEDDKDYHYLITKMGEIEEDQNKEDENMLIRLVKIRQNLWT